MKCRRTFKRRISCRKFKRKKPSYEPEWFRFCEIISRNIFIHTVLCLWDERTHSAERARDTVIVHTRHFSLAWHILRHVCRLHVRKRDIFLFTNPVFIISFFYLLFSIRIHLSSGNGTPFKKHEINPRVLRTFYFSDNMLT